MLRKLAAFLVWVWVSASAAIAQSKNRLSVSGNYDRRSFPLFTNVSAATILLDNSEPEVVKIAARAFTGDIQLLSGKSMQLSHNSGRFIRTIIAGTVGRSKLIDDLVNTGQLDVSAIKGKWESFVVMVIDERKMVIAGSDPRGTAYGFFHLSEAIGVSPWVWWADAVPEKRKELFVKGNYVSAEPSVKYRGIFLNDEDWGLQPWAAKTFEPETGDIGPKTYARIFELLLRLKANLIWPAMHPSTKAFFHYPGNAQMATDYAIVVGSSHAEPMLRNNVDEWKEKTMGSFNFLTNHDTIYKYWEDRVKQSKGFNAFYTLGLRGVHDSKMLGANTLLEQKELLGKAVQEQRQMLAKHIDPVIEKIPQAFIPYKEVQDIYDDGFDVPEDVTLVWCDDNYGYIRHFPNDKERARKGGNGVYYHISYWGRPHDYLWLATSHPAQVYTQMKMAYDKGAREMWVVNVGDIKPTEYLTELFLDMAWDMDSFKDDCTGICGHLAGWINREFGLRDGGRMYDIMQEYYRLAYIRRPEFMGATRTEESDPKYKIVADLPWSEDEINQRLADYTALENELLKLTNKIPEVKRNSWFQLVEYPVRAAAAMNRKLLYAQLARHDKAVWNLSDAAYDTILALTGRYNSLAGGKWKYMMDFQPRKLAVFDKAVHGKAGAPLLQPVKPLFLLNGKEYKGYTGKKPVFYNMGYDLKAVSLPRGSTVHFQVETSRVDSVTIVVALAPNHAVEGTKIRYAIQLDDEPVQMIDYATQGRSEEWKQNVLRNQAIRSTRHFMNKPGKHIIKITALDEGVILDQVKVFVP